MNDLLNWLRALATSVPLEVFVFIGSILEEIIAPIPAPVVMGMAGYIARQEGQGLVYFLWLAVIGTVGKTIASWAFYVIGDKAEDAIVHHWGKYLGINQRRLDQVIDWLDKGWWDEVLLVGLRIVPIIPTFILSIVCGVLKIRMKTFLWTTFVGSLVRNFVIVWLGAMSVEYSAQIFTIQAEFTEQPFLIVVAIVGLVIGGCCAIWMKKTASKTKSPSS